MPKDRRAGNGFRSSEEFHHRFRRAFGRDMTAEERRFLELASLMLDNGLSLEPTDDRDSQPHTQAADIPLISKPTLLQ